MPFLLDCSCSFSLGLKPATGTSHVIRCAYMLWISLATTIVTLGGLAALQDECGPTGASALLGGDILTSNSGVWGFSALPCKTLYRYQWFIIALEIVVVIAALAAVSSNQLAKYRVSLIGLFAVTTLLWINMSNAFLSAQLAGNNQMSQGTTRDRLRTAIAGSIMTATFNCFNILLLGYEEEEVQSSVTVTQAE